MHITETHSSVINNLFAIAMIAVGAAGFQGVVLNPALGWIAVGLGSGSLLFRYMVMPNADFNTKRWLVISLNVILHAGLATAGVLGGLNILNYQIIGATMAGTGLALLAISSSIHCIKPFIDDYMYRRSNKDWTNYNRETDSERQAADAMSNETNSDLTHEANSEQTVENESANNNTNHASRNSQSSAAEEDEDDDLESEEDENEGETNYGNYGIDSHALRQQFANNPGQNPSVVLANYDINRIVNSNTRNT